MLSYSEFVKMAADYAAYPSVQRNGFLDAAPGVQRKWDANRFGKLMHGIDMPTPPPQPTASDVVSQIRNNVGWTPQAQAIGALMTPVATNLAAQTAAKYQAAGKWNNWMKGRYGQPQKPQIESAAPPAPKTRLLDKVRQQILQGRGAAFGLPQYTGK